MAPSLARSALALAMLLACDGDEPSSHRAAPAVPLDEGVFELPVGTVERVPSGTPSSPLRRPVVAEPEHGYELAIQGGRLVESLGFEGADGEFVPILNSGSPLPAVARESFSTVSDNQPTIELHLLAAADDGRSLGILEIVDVAPAPRGVPLFEIVFEVDERGRITIEVKHADSGAPQVFVARWGAQPSDESAEVPIPMCSALAAELVEALDEAEHGRKKKRKRHGPSADEVARSIRLDARLREDLGLDDARIRDIVFTVVDMEPHPDMPVDGVVTLQDLMNETCPPAEAPR